MPHTPAPWMIEEYGDDETPTLVIHRGETESRICFMATPGSRGDPAMIKADAKLIAAGEAKFHTTCAVCHGEKAEGKVGPNLTDKFWIHGKGTLADIYATIAQGVLEKGMPSWALTLQPDELKALAIYIGTLRGRNVPGKEPQGNPVELPIATSPAAAATPTAP